MTKLVIPRKPFGMLRTTEGFHYKARMSIPGVDIERIILYINAVIKMMGKGRLK